MTKQRQFAYLIFSVIALIILFLFYLTRTAAFQTAPDSFVYAIVLDLVVTIPIFYLYLIRKTDTPKFTIVYAILFGILLASLIIPADQQGIVTKLIKYLIPILELIILFVLVHKVWSLRKNYKENHQNQSDFYTNILNASAELLPGRIGKVLATEVSVFYYLFKSKKTEVNNENSFSYHQKSGIKSVVGVLLFILLAETVVVHIFVERWNVQFAWVLSFLSLYTGFQILSILRSMDKRLIEIDVESKQLLLRYGFAAQTTIRFSQILKVEKKRNFKSDTHVSLSVFDLLETPNVVIHLTEKASLQKLYGFEKAFESISFYVDNKEDFVHHVESIIKGIKASDD